MSGAIAVAQRSRSGGPISAATERADRRGAGALGAVGEQLGIALVQPGDGVAQVVVGEDLEPLASPLRIDLDQHHVIELVRAGIERSAGGPARRHGQAAERERVAQGC